ncbi:MAG TPA: response regulator [Burkholderiales bacterium]|nr:response regulator [Burkholderiales bacterium]
MTARILIIDDSPTNLKLAAFTLKSEGFIVEVATDAEHAQKVLLDMTPDLILMDIALPGMNGLTLTRKLKADEKLKHIPVVALTAFAMMGDERKALDAGCDGYITKPIDTRKFSQQVAAYLPRQVGK